MSVARNEGRTYFFRSYVSHLFEGGDYAELCRTLEQTTFLERQADYFGGFQTTGADLEQRALPAVLDERDWSRFLHYAALALNLRGMAESLADERVLAALARAGRTQLARDVADGLNDPLRRAVAKSAVAAALGPESPLFGSLREELLRDLSSAPPEDEDGARIGAEAMERIVHALGVHLGTSWTDWVRRLRAWPELADRLCQAVARRCLHERRLGSPDLWQALAEIGDPARLKTFLPRCLDALEVADFGPFLERLRSLADDEEPGWRELLWLGRFAWLGRQALASPELAFTTWQRLCDDPAPPWSITLVEAAGRFLGSLSGPELDVLAEAEFPDAPTLRCAMYVVALEGRPADTRCRRRAAGALTWVPDGSRLHWSLRYLATRAPDAAARRQVAAVLTYLLERRLVAPAEDLARLLDLVVRHRPAELAREVDRVVASPATTPETLLAIVEHAREEAVLQRLFERAEHYVAAVSPDEATGFARRGELLKRLARRLVPLRGPRVLDQAAERLLRAEEDELRAVLAPELASTGRKALAEQVARGIADPRLRLLTRLELEPDPETLDALLRARSLYSAMADVGALRDEQLALALLQEPSGTSRRSSPALRRIEDEETRTRALLRLAEQDLRSEIARRGPRSDRSAALERIRDAMSFADLGQLAELTPALAELGALRGRGWAVAEYQEALQRLMELREVAWPLRRQALEDLLTRIGCSSRGRQAAKGLDAFFRVGQVDPRHWWESLPMVLATLDRLGGDVERELARPVWTLWPARHPHDGTNRRDWLRRRVRAMGFVAPPEAQPLAEACLAEPAECLRLARELSSQDRPPSAVLEALVYLLAGRRPREVLPLVGRHPQRDELILRLVRHRWLPALQEAKLCDLASAPAARLEARLWHRLRGKATDPSAWLAILGELAAQHGLDPSRAENEPLLHHLRTLDDTADRSVLARAALDALRLGAAARGEATLRLWLHAHPGASEPAALERARSLSPELPPREEASCPASEAP